MSTVHPISVTGHIFALAGLDLLTSCNPKLLRHFDLSVVDPTKPWNSVNVGIFM